MEFPSRQAGPRLTKGSKDAALIPVILSKNPTATRILSSIAHDGPRLGHDPCRGSVKGGVTGLTGFRGLSRKNAAATPRLYSALGTRPLTLAGVGPAWREIFPRPLCSTTTRSVLRLRFEDHLADGTGDEFRFGMENPVGAVGGDNVSGAGMPADPILVRDAPHPRPDIGRRIPGYKVRRKNSRRGYRAAEGWH